LQDGQNCFRLFGGAPPRDQVGVDGGSSSADPRQAFFCICLMVLGRALGVANDGAWFVSPPQAIPPAWRCHSWKHLLLCHHRGPL